MKRILFLLIGVLFLTGSDYCRKFPTDTPLKVCVPSDSNPNCGGSETDPVWTSDKPNYFTVAQGSTKQNVLNGTGFVKQSGLTTSYDNSTYLTSVASDSTWTGHNSYPLACNSGQYVSAIGDTLTCANPVTESDNTWTTHDSYPTGCSAGNAVQAIGDTLTCVSLGAGGGGGWADETTYTNLTYDYDIVASGDAYNNQSECSQEGVGGDEIACNGAGCMWVGTCGGGEGCDAYTTQSSCEENSCEWTSDEIACQANPAGDITDYTAGTQMLWLPKRGAFRAGRFTGTEWHNAGVGMFSTAFGKNNVASGDLSLSGGMGSVASGAWSTAIGLTNTASGTGAVSLGTSCQASTAGSVCIGRVNTVTGTGSVALGFNNTADGEACFVVGDGSACHGLGSIAMGAGAAATGIGSVAIGSASVLIDGGFSLGSGTTTAGQGATSMGFWSYARGVGSVSMNDNTYALGSGSIAANNKTISGGVASFSGGYDSLALGSESIAFGNSAIASGDSSAAFGEVNHAYGKASFVAGSSNSVTAPYSYAIGRDGTVTGTNSFLINLGTDAGTNGTCMRSSFYDCTLDEDETSCVFHGCVWDGECNNPAEKVQPDPCSNVYIDGVFLGSEYRSKTICERIPGCSYDDGDTEYDWTDDVCYENAQCGDLVTMNTCNGQIGCSWVEEFESNPETVSDDGVFAVMNGKVGINDESPSVELEVTGEAKVSGISGDGTGKAVCIKSDGALGTCSTAPNASGVCTCG